MYIYMKFILIFLCFFLGFLNFVSAQDTISNSGSVTVEENLDLNSINNDNINNVSFAFCNNWFNTKDLFSTLNLNMDLNQKKHICVIFINHNKEPISLSVGFLPGTINANGNVICQNSEKYNSWIIVDSPLFSGELILEPNKNFVEYFSLRTDSSLLQSGTYYTCLVFNNYKPGKKNWMFEIIVRKDAPITLNVSWRKYYFNWFDDIIFWVKGHISQISFWWIIVLIVLLWYVLLVPDKEKSKKNINKK